MNYNKGVREKHKATELDADTVEVRAKDMANAVSSVMGEDSFFRAICENLPELIHCVDSTGHINFSNRSWFEEMGYSKDEALGRDAEFPLSPDLETEASKVLVENPKINGVLGSVQGHYIRKDSSTFPVRVMLTRTGDGAGREIIIWAAYPIERSSSKSFGKAYGGKHFLERIQSRAAELMGLEESGADPLETATSGAAPDAEVYLLAAEIETGTEAIILIDERGRIAAYNKLFVNMWNIPGDAIESGHYRQALTHALDQIINPQAFFRKVIQVQNSREAKTFDVLNLKDGRIVTATSRPIASHSNKYSREWRFKDITDNDSSILSVAPATGQFQNLAETAAIGLAICDTAGTVVVSNKKFNQIISSLSEDAIKEKNLIKSTQMERSGIAATISSCLQKGRGFVREYSLKERKGAPIHLRVHGVPIMGEYGAIEGANLVFEDTTNEKRSDAILIKSERYKAVAKMVEGLTGVFQESIHSMAFLSEQALEKLKSDQAESALKLMKRVRSFGKQSNQALRQLQLFTRSRSDIDTTMLRVMDLSDIVREAVEDLGLSFKDSKGSNPEKPSVDLNLEPGCYIEGVHNEMVEVMVNFLNNARDACAQGGLIFVETGIKGESVILRVQDNGEGFEQEIIEKMIEPFWTNKSGHAGLGLAVNFAIVKRHGGKMGVKRLKPRGASFSAKFPLAKKIPHERQSAPQPEKGGKLRILLIDDDQPIVETLEKGLSKLGIKVFTAYSGRQGLELFERNKLDAIVCDLAMEGMNGWEVSKAVFASSLERNIQKPPFIMLTGWGGQLAREERVYHPDVDKILEKPITILKLLEVVDELTAKT